MAEPSKVPQPVVQGFCMMADEISKHVYNALEDRQVREDLFDKALEDFRSGRPLADVARDLVDIGLATEKDVAYVESLPRWMHDAIQASIRGYLERDERWTIYFAHEQAATFSLRFDEDEDVRLATLVLAGPHDGPA